MRTEYNSLNGEIDNCSIVREISRILQKRVDKMLECDEGKQIVVVDELVCIVGRRGLILKTGQSPLQKAVFTLL